MTAYAEGFLWFYAPNKGAAIAFAVLFAMSCIIHVAQAFRYKQWKIPAFLIWGSLILTVGYSTRAVGAWNYDHLGVFIASSVLLVMGPPVYAACLYLTLGRTMYYIPWLAPLHPGRVITTFLGLDALCEAVLGAGAPRISNDTLSETERTIGWALIKAGMILQVILLISFLLLAGHFHHKCIRNGVVNRVRRLVVLLYATGVLILERSILRTVEMFEGYTGTVYTSEPIFYVLEASVMLLTSVILNVWHPSRLLPGDYKVYLATDGVTERRGPGWKDKRPFFITLVDPFDVRRLFTKKYANDRFWERDEGGIVGVVADPPELLDSSKQGTTLSVVEPSRDTA